MPRAGNSALVAVYRKVSEFGNKPVTAAGIKVCMAEDCVGFPLAKHNRPNKYFRDRAF